MSAQSKKEERNGSPLRWHHKGANSFRPNLSAASRFTLSGAELDYRFADGRGFRTVKALVLTHDWRRGVSKLKTAGFAVGAKPPRKSPQGRRFRRSRKCRTSWRPGGEGSGCCCVAEMSPRRNDILPSGRLLFAISATQTKNITRAAPAMKTPRTSPPCVTTTAATRLSFCLWQ